LTGVFLAVFAGGCSHAPSSTERAEAAVQPGRGLTVEVRPGSGLYAARGLYSVILRFHNAGPEAVAILKPLEGSLECKYMPYYRFSVWDRDHKPLKPMRPACPPMGLQEGTQWPQDYLVEIKPGASFDLEQPLACEVERDGPHTVAFEYVYQPTNETLAPPAGVWRGSVKADAVMLNVKRE
jgi:hypothetical protein